MQVAKLGIVKQVSGKQKLAMYLLLRLLSIPMGMAIYLRLRLLSIPMGMRNSAAVDSELFARLSLNLQHYETRLGQNKKLKTSVVKLSLLPSASCLLL